MYRGFRIELMIEYDGIGNNLPRNWVMVECINDCNAKAIYCRVCKAFSTSNNLSVIFVAVALI